MKHFEVNNQKCLAKEVPHGNYEYIIRGISNVNYTSSPGLYIIDKGANATVFDLAGNTRYFFVLPEGSWKIVGLAGDWSTWQSGIIDKGKEWNMVHNADCIKQRYNLSDNHLILKQL